MFAALIISTTHLRLATLAWCLARLALTSSSQAAGSSLCGNLLRHATQKSWNVSELLMVRRVSRVTCHVSMLATARLD